MIVFGNRGWVRYYVFEKINLIKHRSWQPRCSYQLKNINMKSWLEKRRYRPSWHPNMWNTSCDRGLFDFLNSETEICLDLIRICRYVRFVTNACSFPLSLLRYHFAHFMAGRRIPMTIMIMCMIAIKIEVFIVRVYVLILDGSFIMH